MAEPVLPTITDLNRPFWEGAAQGELRFQRCDACGHLRYPISPICPRCLETRTTWTAVSGRATVQTFVVFDRAYHPSRADDVPYAVAIVQTEEGPRMISDVVQVDARSVAVGDPLIVTFERASDEIVVPRFRPAGD